MKNEKNNKVTNYGFIPADALRKLSTRLLLLAVTMMAIFSTQAQEKKPNIVYILVDNVGWGAWGVYGGNVPTPRIDKLASEGIRFNNYNVEAQCTPSRSAIHTGRHAVRSGTFTVPFPGQGKAGLCPWEYTIAELLSDAGYATALFGKWHLGDSQGRLPNDQGYDEWWGCMNSWDESGYTAWPQFKETGMPEPMIWAGVKGQPSKPVMPLDLNLRPVVDEKYIIPKTIDFIKRKASEKKPFFVYVGYSEFHEPIMPNPNFGKEVGPFSEILTAVIKEMDYRIGQVIDAVKAAGVEDNTIFILSSDNADGGASAMLGGNTNGPFRGDFFYTPFEGSMRVPCIVRWPGKVKAGVVTEEMLAAVDWLPTFAGLVGAPNLVPKDRPIDGIDASDFIMGKKETTGRDSYAFFGNDGQLMSIKWKQIKTVFRYTDRNSEYHAIGSPYVKPQLPLVFNLASDPHEDNNLFYSDLTNGFLLAPDFRVIAEFERSVAQYPNIKVGEEFTGYKK